MDATPEEWRPVVGYEGLYEVSSLGRVRSLDHVQRGKDGVLKRWRGRMMKLNLGSTGYYRVNLTINASQKLHKVHVLVLEAFHGQRPFPGACGRHLNDIRTDNRSENLAWGTVAENNRDIVRNGNNFNANKTHCKRGHEFTPQNTGPNAGGNRVCRACNNLREREKRAALRAQREQMMSGVV